MNLHLPTENKPKSLTLLRYWPMPQPQAADAAPVLGLPKGPVKHRSLARNLYVAGAQLAFSDGQVWWMVLVAAGGG